jgi:S1-C subfamily serine protease
MRQLSLRGGVQITKVDEKSVAEEAGLGEGMIVTGVVTGGVFSPINNIMDFTDLDRRLRSGSSVVLSVRVPDNQYSRDISIPVKVK